jgi:hypothetical protein
MQVGVDFVDGCLLHHSGQQAHLPGLEIIEDASVSVLPPGVARR